MSVIKLVEKYLKDNSGTAFEFKDIKKAAGENYADNSIYSAISEIKRTNPNVRTVKNGRKVSYIWDDTNSQKNKNPEGYSDPTASAAIASCEQTPGEVWSSTTSSGNEELCLVVANHGTYAVNVIRLIKASESNSNLVKIPVTVTVNADVYVGDASMLTYKWRKYLCQCVHIVTAEKLDRIRTQIREALDLKTRTVSKIIYKEAPAAPVEEKVKPQIPEGYEIAMALLKQERDIWKEVATKLLDKA